MLEPTVPEYKPRTYLTNCSTVLCITCSRPVVEKITLFFIYFYRSSKPKYSPFVCKYPIYLLTNQLFLKNMLKKNLIGMSYLLRQLENRTLYTWFHKTPKMKPLFTPEICYAESLGPSCINLLVL